MEQGIEESQGNEIKKWSWNKQPNQKSKRSVRPHGIGSNLKVSNKAPQTVENRTDQVHSTALRKIPKVGGTSVW